MSWCNVLVSHPWTGSYSSSLTLISILRFHAQICIRGLIGLHAHKFRIKESREKKCCSNILPNYLITDIFEFCCTRREKIRDKIMPPWTTVFASTLNNCHQTNSIFLQKNKKIKCISIPKGTKCRQKRLSGLILSITGEDQFNHKVVYHDEAHN